jgi:hypothetical protein
MSNGVVVVPYLFVSADVHVIVVAPPVGEAVHQSRVAVEGEGDGPVLCER